MSNILTGELLRTTDFSGFVKRLTGLVVRTDVSGLFTAPVTKLGEPDECLLGQV